LDGRCSNHPENDETKLNDDDDDDGDDDEL